MRIKREEKEALFFHNKYEKPSTITTLGVVFSINVTTLPSPQ